MLMGVVALAHQYRTTKVRLSFPKLILFFLPVFGLNIFSNLLRILILVLFKIQPDNLLHDVTGILCLIGYVIVPIFFISRWMVLKMGSDNELRTLNGKNFRLRLAVLPLSFMLVFTGAHIHAEKKKTYNATPVIVKIPGFTSTHSDNGVTKLYNREVLIYIKPIAEFFSGEHTPLMCWKGSGYRFESIKRIDLDNKEIYVAQLVNGNRTLFTAWWYANGAVQTINQFDWRYRMLKGENKFSLINVTAGDKQTLYNNLKAILLINFAQPAFHQHSNYDASYL
jgi:exosortase N